MNAHELEQAAKQIRASNHAAAQQIADLLDHAAFMLHNRETNWTLCEYSPTIQRDLTTTHFGREIAIAQALTTGNE